MNANARKWIAALRSGEYRQGRGLLCSLFDGEKYCCLGVACELYRQENPGYTTEDSSARARRTYGINRNAIVLPPEVASWLGLNNSLGSHIYGRNAKLDLINANDTQCLTFPQIADLIESHPPGLFKESTEAAKPEQSEVRSVSPSGARDLVAADA